MTPQFSEKPNDPQSKSIYSAGFAGVLLGRSSDLRSSLLHWHSSRRAEVYLLHIDNIHVDRQVLFINQGKGQRDRYVPIGLRALLWIAHYVQQAREHLAIDPKERTLFLTLLGAPINSDSLTEYGRRYIKSANIEKPGAFHVFRHTLPRSCTTLARTSAPFKPSSATPSSTLLRSTLKSV
ncbi:MAG: tyrosine-type recombinase/integrase [Pirellulaceae bacterium]|nr:tyrosine-type recombinase/integrase [Pirellulaceae bacterium]